MCTVANAWRVHYKPSTRLASIWRVVIASRKRMHAQVLLTTFLYICITMRVHLNVHCALHEQCTQKFIASSTINLESESSEARERQSSLN